jgi:hypothetical protein
MFAPVASDVSQTHRVSGSVRLQPDPAAPSAETLRGRMDRIRAGVKAFGTVCHPAPPDMLEAFGRMGDGEPGIVVLATDDQGLARAAQVLTEPPAQRDYLPIVR